MTTLNYQLYSILFAGYPCSNAFSFLCYEIPLTRSFHNLSLTVRYDQLYSILSAGYPCPTALPLSNPSGQQ
jgi:hypothetical protein